MKRQKNEKQKNEKWKCLFLEIVFNPKTKSLTLKNVSISLHQSKEEALGFTSINYGLHYVKDSQESAICWDGNYSGYCTHLYKVCFISKYDTPQFTFSISDKYTNNKLRSLLKEMYEDWRSHPKSIYVDMSVEMSNFAWQTTIPKGYKLLRVGSIIKENDLEFDKMWGTISWYNVGKKVKKGYGMTYKNSKGKIYKRTEGENDPLIIRKNIITTNDKESPLHLGL